MGDLIRFPGADVDYEYLDRFVWTDELLADYAARARALAQRYGSRSPEGLLPHEPPGPCDDCGCAAPRRFRLGDRLLCGPCSEPRVRVREELAEWRPPPAPVGSVGEGLTAYQGLWRIAWTAEELERRQAQARRRGNSARSKTTAAAAPGSDAQDRGGGEEDR